MALVKSHSNYVLKSRHQALSDGSVVWERDITTIGGLNQFAPGQTPIYRSGNFIITVRDDRGMSNQYTKKKWKGNQSGDSVWTLKDVSGSTDNDEQNDIKIVIKNDYYDLMDFAYYGSLSELFRSSINDAMARFPGELYVTDKEYDYEFRTRNNGEPMYDSVVIGAGSYYVSNPFGIDIHSKDVPADGDPYKFFCNGGYKNYTVNGSEINEGEYSVTYYDFICPDVKKGERASKIATVKIKTVTIDVWLTIDKNVIYVSKNKGVHITPVQSRIDKFYNECNAFQKLILNPESDPKYKATFSVIYDTDQGTFRKFETFIFPTSAGGYNIEPSDNYTSRFVEIGAFYDEYYTDNLYRSMTHEAIKNFDWTYTREFNEEDAEENIFGGERMRKVLRICAREFDDILQYINAIRNVGRVTYDDRSNLPNYFMSDAVEGDGWDVSLVYPYKLTEKKDGKTLPDNGYTTDNQLCNEYEREFSQDPAEEFTPYDEDMLGDYKNGYFVTCCGEGIKTCRYNDGTYTILKASEGETIIYDECANGNKGAVKKRIRSYSNQEKYTHQDLSNEFLRRLKINSPHILRHKGTVDGVEMILALFGMKSERYVKGLPKWMRECNDCKDCCTGNDLIEADYKIEEFYAKVDSYIEDERDRCHDNMYEADWINTTKMITYDYRSVSNYTRLGSGGHYVPYQGLTVIPWKCEVTGNKLPLYPYFSNYEKFDGDPYFQMDGGWLSKRMIVDGKDYGFQYDLDNNIVHTEPNSTSRIFKETIRKVRRYDTLQDMLSVVQTGLRTGTIAYVTDISSDLCVIDGKVYTVFTEADENCEQKQYVKLIKQNGVISAGGNRFFTTTVIVYDNTGNPNVYRVDNKPNGYVIKAYIVNNRFMCGGNTYEVGDDYNVYLVNYFKMMSDYDEGYTNYFKLNNIIYSDRLSDGNSVGWVRLKFTDDDYKKVNCIENYNDGNNPHNGSLSYDLGNSYFENFKRIFGYAYDHDLFDFSCYDNKLWTAEENYKITKWGFTFDNGGTYDIGGVKLFTQDYKDNADNDYNTYYDYEKVVDVNLRKDADKKLADEVIKYREYKTPVNASELKNSRIHKSLIRMNSKNIRVTFYLHYDPLSRKGQCEMKYIDDIVLNYMTQMIPSTAILEVMYKKR